MGFDATFLFGNERTKEWLGAYESGQGVKYIVSTVQPMPTVSRSKPNGCTVVATVDSLIGK